MAANTQRIVYNHDISGFSRRINRFIVELIKSVSSSSSLVNNFDQTRLQSYIGALRGYLAWVNEQPQLDLPDTHPRSYALDADPEVPDMENESMVDAVRMLELARDELCRSQSARNASGLLTFDSDRLEAIVNKVDSFLNTYIAEVTPLDFPESSPQTELTGPGQTGV